MLPDTKSRRPSPEQCLLSIVLPVYNEAEVLETLLACVESAAKKTEASYEIVFVNDGSTDGTGALLDVLCERHESMSVVHLSRNFGHQAAVLAGLTHATGDAVVVMDSDMQDNPRVIPQFFAAWQAGYDVVYAVRTDRKEGPVKRLMFAGFHRFLAAISRTPIPRDAGNFGLVDRRVVRVIVDLDERDRYYPGLRSWVGFRQTGIPVERGARYDDQPRVALSGLFRLANTAIFSFSTFPLRVFNLLGYSALVIFVLLGSFSVACKLFTELAIPGWTSHIMSACFFGAINALGISIVGEYVVRIYDEVRRRPAYIVDRQVGGRLAAMPPVERRTWSDQSRIKGSGRSLSLANEAEQAYGDLLVTVQDMQSTVATVMSAPQREPGPLSDQTMLLEGCLQNDQASLSSR
jgi:dolichol-phosphate mannosyltransferase